ncbi:MAG: UDP-3-O-(3-hydroxymyristoyl)glucosamine N-acyltransferase [Zetaproteobacteria bacterium]|nr:MAG: UDP-3-O-(3-hydroxymyristoyl)glucosamine N-acyltransferase [Zetaproteobacteria bacterium]
MFLRDIAGLVGGKLEHADPESDITGVSTLEHAGPDHASFLANMRYKTQFETSRAGVILLNHKAFPNGSRPVLRVADPYLAFAILQCHYHPAKQASGLRHASAVIDTTASLAEDVDVGPLAVIGKNVHIGSGSRIGSGCIVEDDARIGDSCVLHSRTVVGAACELGNNVILQPGAVIGSDGFGYAWTGREHLKIPQTGRVLLEDDVEIGANTCIDRGAIGDTVIGQGVKLDNLIQIGHNVKIGAYSIMASQVGISGSTVIGQGCQFGGQAGTAGHLHIGDGCKIAAKSGVSSDLEAGGTYAGFPAMPHRLWLRISAITLRLPELWKTFGNRSGK